MTFEEVHAYVMTFFPSESQGSGPDGNGEQVCEGHGLDEGDCAQKGCCQWDENSGACYSAVGQDMCFPDSNEV